MTDDELKNALAVPFTFNLAHAVPCACGKPSTRLHTNITTFISTPVCDDCDPWKKRIPLRFYVDAFCRPYVSIYGGRWMKVENVRQARLRAASRLKRPSRTRIGRCCLCGARAPLWANIRVCHNSASCIAKHNRILRVTKRVRVTFDKETAVEFRYIDGVGV